FAQGKTTKSALKELLAELAMLAPDEQIHRVTTDSRFANPHLIQRLVEMSLAVRYEDAASMLHLADLARLAAESCDAATAGSAPKLADLRAQSWSSYANALRVSGQLHEADEAFVKALRSCNE